MIRVQADLLPFGCGKRPGRLPDRVRDADPAEVVQQRADAEADAPSLVHAQPVGGGDGEVGHPAGVAER